MDKNFQSSTSEKLVSSTQRKGASAVEFAMIAPLIFLLLFGGIEFIRGNIVRHTANNAAYEAARLVISPGANRSEAVDKAEQILALAGINDATIDIEPNEIDEDTAFVTATINVPMNTNSWGISRLLAGKTLTARVQLRTERSPAIQAQNLPTVLNPPPPPPAPPEDEHRSEPEDDGNEENEPEPTQPRKKRTPKPRPAIRL